MAAAAGGYTNTLAKKAFLKSIHTHIHTNIHQIHTYSHIPKTIIQLAVTAGGGLSHLYIMAIGCRSRWVDVGKEGFFEKNIHIFTQTYTK